MAFSRDSGNALAISAAKMPVNRLSKVISAAAANDR